MARISVEDCLRNVESPFSLVHAAVRRARQLQMGSKPLMQKKGDKNTVIALREIAHGLVEQVPLSELEEEIHAQAAVNPEEEFSQIFDSPDLNVGLDADQEEEEATKTSWMSGRTRKGRTTKTTTKTRPARSTPSQDLGPSTGPRGPTRKTSQRTPIRVRRIVLCSPWGPRACTRISSGQKSDPWGNLIARFFR
jgi:DNA-directed RNA polymerase subunit omega